MVAERGSSIPAYVVATDATLEALAEHQPSSEEELAAIRALALRSWPRTENHCWCCSTGTVDSCLPDGQRAGPGIPLAENKLDDSRKCGVVFPERFDDQTGLPGNATRRCRSERS